MQALIHLPAVGAPGASAGVLGLVERDVGAAQQFIGLVGVGRCQRHADAGADADLLILVDERSAQRINDSVAQPIDIVVFAHAMEHDDELVAAQARHQVAIAGALAQT